MQLTKKLHSETSASWVLVLHNNRTAESFLVTVNVFLMHTGFTLCAQIQTAGSQNPHIHVPCLHHCSPRWAVYLQAQLLKSSLQTKYMSGFPLTCYLVTLKEVRQWKKKGSVEAIPTQPLPPLQPVCAEPVEFYSHRGLFVSLLVSCLGLPWSVSWVCKCVADCDLLYSHDNM